MSSCQNFKQKIEEFKKKTEKLRLALEQYKNGEKEYLEIFEEGYGRLEKEIEEFKSEYKKKVKKMIPDWHDVLDKNLKFNETGRIFFERNIDNFFMKTRGYFPYLIIEVKGDVDLRNTEIKHNVDNLEKIGGLLRCDKNRIQSFKRLKEVNGNLVVDRYIKFESLEKILEDLFLLNNKDIETVEDFLKIFPKLKKVRNIIIFETQSSLKPEFEKLKNEGKLEFEEVKCWV